APPVATARAYARHLPSPPPSPTRRSSDLDLGSEAARVALEQPAELRADREGEDEVAGRVRSVEPDPARVERRERLPRVRVEAERSEEHTSELQSRVDLVCRLLLEKKKRTR